MTSWRIVPAAVESVLSAVDADAAEVNSVLSQNAIDGMYEPLAWGGALTSAVPDAITRVFTEQQRNLKIIADRVGAGVLGVGNATIAYINGQHEMCATFQSEFLKSAESGNRAFFTEHGYEGWRGQP